MFQELPEELVADIPVERVTQIHGGDIAKAFRLDGPQGTFFLKTHPRPRNQMFEREARGLEALRAVKSPLLGVPSVVAASSRGLVLEWIDAGRSTAESELIFGRGLARLHKAKQPYFGGLGGDESGYIGSVEVDLRPTDRWRDFYVERRLRPLISRAIDAKVLSPDAAPLFDHVSEYAEVLCGPEEPPALVHGDLWGGNRMVDRAGKSWIIDPAAHYAHREVDIAMMLLFGGFGYAAFSGYNYSYPLAPGWRDRVPWYQLAPLLVHALLFGGGYGAAVLGVLKRLADSLD